MYIMNNKKAKKVYVTVLLFYSIFNIWVHVESPKYKTICLKSPKSSEFAIYFNKLVKILNYIYVIMF